jgi:hypothetical protein
MREALYRKWLPGVSCMENRNGRKEQKPRNEVPQGKETASSKTLETFPTTTQYHNSEEEH